MRVDISSVLKVDPQIIMDQVSLQQIVFDIEVLDICYSAGYAGGVRNLFKMYSNKFKVDDIRKFEDNNIAIHDNVVAQLSNYTIPDIDYSDEIDRINAQFGCKVDEKFLNNAKVLSDYLCLALCRACGVTFGGIFVENLYLEHLKLGRYSRYVKEVHARHKTLSKMHSGGLELAKFLYKNQIEPVIVANGITLDLEPDFEDVSDQDEQQPEEGDSNEKTKRERGRRRHGRKLKNMHRK
ncbi:MAG: hypothetical protein LBR22_03535 [Desulfovibrio sp.]|nr:hypothetical protein [Desulfovibrio sp.]